MSEEFKYFPDIRIFEKGADSIVTCFRRCVVICGLVFHRESAIKFETNEFDGTLLYQQHLVAEILKIKRALYLPNVLALYRNGGTPEFGNSKKEAGLFVPGQQTPDSSVQFMRGMLKIAAAKDPLFPGQLYQGILQDLANYSYPFLAIQSNQKKLVFFDYYVKLCKIGFGKFFMFHLYFWGLFVLGNQRLGQLIKWIKNKLGYTPILGSVYRGEQQ